MVAPQVQRRDAEAELNLPPGFRFHPTDEELVAHYLCARAAGRRPPVPIIAELDLYRFDPWDLPERALFGRREWYFFTPRDRKYPNGSRPNRAAGTGYWKATGADKPVAHGGRTVGIKKALVFYHGKPPRGVKTEWIMHEYRLADAATKKKPGTGSLRLDDWVLCRLYNKKNEWEKMQQQEEEKETEASLSHSHSCGETRTPESEIDDDAFPELASLPAFDDMGPPAGAVLPKEEVQEMDGLGLGADDWLAGINLDDLHSCTSVADAHPNKTEGEEGCFGGIKTESGEESDIRDVPSAPAAVCGETRQSDSSEIVNGSQLLSSDESFGANDPLVNAYRNLPGDEISDELTCAFQENGVLADELLAVSKDNPDEKENAIGSMLSDQDNCTTNEPESSHFIGSQNFADALHQMSKVRLEGESGSEATHLTSPAEPVHQTNGAVSDACGNQCTPEVIHKHSVSCRDESENIEDDTTVNEVLCTDVNSDPSFFEEFSGGNDRLLDEEDLLPTTSHGSPSSQQEVTSNEGYCFYDPYRWTPEEIKAATGNDECTYVEHNLKLRSVYTDVEDFEGTKDANKEPLVTSYNSKFMGTVDYIWASEDLQTVQVLDTFPKEILKQTIGFPTKKWGSDHIALVCELAFMK